jgi:hypothetical protein
MPAACNVNFFTRTSADYGLPTTVPIPGESLSSGALIRWYQRRFQLLVFTVCRFVLVQIYPLPNVFCTRVGQGCLFGYLARSEFPCPPDRHDSA